MLKLDWESSINWQASTEKCSSSILYAGQLNSVNSELKKEQNTFVKVL